MGENNFCTLLGDVTHIEGWKKKHKTKKDVKLFFRSDVLYFAMTSFLKTHLKHSEDFISSESRSSDWWCKLWFVTLFFLDSFSHAVDCIIHTHILSISVHASTCVSLRPAQWMSQICVSLWSRLCGGSCSAGPWRDKDVISCYLWLAKWRSPGPACLPPFPCQPVMAPINQAQSCRWQESSSRTMSPLCVYIFPPVCTCDMQAWALQNPHGTIIHPPPPHSTNSGR